MSPWEGPGRFSGHRLFFGAASLQCSRIIRVQRGSRVMRPRAWVVRALPWTVMAAVALTCLLSASARADVPGLPTPTGGAPASTSTTDAPIASLRPLALRPRHRAPLSPIPARHRRTVVPRRPALGRPPRRRRSRQVPARPAPAGGRGRAPPSPARLLEPEGSTPSTPSTTATPTIEVPGTTASTPAPPPAAVTPAVVTPLG